MEISSLAQHLLSRHPYAWVIMRRFINWAIHTALGNADLVLSGAPIPAIVASHAIASATPVFRATVKRARSRRAQVYAGTCR